MPGDEEILPLAAEEVRITTRTIETGRVRVDINTVPHTEQVTVNLAETRASVEHVPVGRFVETAPPTRQEGEVTIIPVLEERAVVTIRLYLREELHVRSRTVHRLQRHDVTLRRQQATVARTGANTETTEGRKRDE
ncbi:conserved protein of unknown function [Rhodovastum atsumiense]|uniref:DUF2382 domain-containing protein n=1 Tax=Rhodovastum atsumiense TaxID=504468 RepID=A0A5M6INC4_9PROT|nr:YsnF/AvaK domain-containing protein [Rhodovastum atsumiense]KAA5609763.1 DUF2382 domain-containing protein [Rhodovastum atsumiense]CAH2599460.1 conserved protein of unknown function [Rhodovastum atsumiense]